MIELERDESQDIEVWADNDFSHVIVGETEDTYPYSSPGPGWYVRDEQGEMGPYPTFELALEAARAQWGDVTLAAGPRKDTRMTIVNAQRTNETAAVKLAERYADRPGRLRRLLDAARQDGREQQAERCALALDLLAGRRPSPAMTDPIQDFLDAPPAREIDELRARRYRTALAEADSGPLSEDEEREQADRVR